MADSVVGILLRAKKETGAIGEVKEEILDVRTAGDSATSGLDGLKSNLNEVGDYANIAAGGLQSMAAAAGLAGVVKLASTAYEVARVGAEAERTERAFNRMASSMGQDGDTMLAALKKASLGTISDRDLELDATRAKVLGVADSVDKLSTLLQVARVRGAEFGYTTQEALGFLIDFIGKGSVQVGDNLGFKGAQKDLEDYAASAGKTVAELSAAERNAALFGKVLRETKGEIEEAGKAGLDAAGKFEHFTTSVENARAAIGKEMTPGVTTGTNILSYILDTYTALLERAEKAGNIDFYGHFDEQSNDATQSATALSGAMGGLTQQTITAADAQIGLAAATPKVYAALLATVPGFQIVQDMATATSNKLALLQDQIDGLQGASISRLAAAAADVEKFASKTEVQDQYTSAVKRTKDAIAAAADEYSKTGNYEKYQLTLAEINRNSTEWFDNMKAGYAKATSDAKSYANAVESDIKRAYENVKSTVDSVLKGAMSDVAGVDPSKILRDPKETDPKKQQFLLPREEDINENARRLADIAVNGLKNQDWLGKFKEAVPDVFKALEESGDPRATAARMLKDFQDGLEPELIDKDKAKERVRKMLLGEAKTNELIKEITDELVKEGAGDASQIEVLTKAAFGIGGGSAKDAAATAGVGGTEAGAAFGKAAAAAAGQASVQTFGTTGTQSGAAFSKAAVDSIAGTGDKLISSLETQLKSDDLVARMKRNGEASGEVWGGGFLNTVGNNVPTALVDLLFSKLVPRFNAYNQTQAQLQGTAP